MTLLMSFVTAEKKTKTNQNKTRNENECEKNRARGKTRQKKDKLNIELFVMLNLRISKSTNFDSSRLQQSSDASKIITLFVTRWLPALTISYLIGSFEIPQRHISFSVRLWQIYSTLV